MEDPWLKIGEIRKILGIEASRVKDFDKDVKFWRERGFIQYDKTGKNNTFFVYKLGEIQREMMLKENKRGQLWFKTDRSKKVGVKMWLPTSTYTTPSKLNSDDKALKNTWFNVSKISVIPFLKDHLKKYSGPKVDPTTGIRAKKYRLYLTKDMIRKYLLWFDINRFIYNKCVEFYYSEKNKGTPYTDIDEGLIYTNVVNQKLSPHKPEIKAWIKQCPAAIKTTTVRDFHNAMVFLEGKREDSIKYAKKYPGRNIKPFEFTMKFRLKRDHQSFTIKDEDIHGDPGMLSCFPTFTKELGPILRSRRGIDKITRDIRIVWNGVRGEGCSISAHVPYDYILKPRGEKIKNCCSIDPGERTFISVYGSDGNAYTIGDRASKKIDNLGKIAQRMRQGIKRVVQTNKKGNPIRDENGHLVKTLVKVTKENTKNPGRTLKRLSEKSKILEARAKRLLSELHHKSAKFLTDNYDTIIIPKFNTKKICEKLNIQGEYKRKIGRDVARRLQRLSHYKFRKLLIAKGGNRVYVGTEEYTSKTCGDCFNLNENLGGKHTFECPSCPLVGHRDLLAARNIMILNADKARLKI